jgi:hypothetical protein
MKPASVRLTNPVLQAQLRIAQAFAKTRVAPSGVGTRQREVALSFCRAAVIPLRTERAGATPISSRAKDRDIHLAVTAIHGLGIICEKRRPGARGNSSERQQRGGADSSRAAAFTRHAQPVPAFAESA